MSKSLDDFFSEPDEKQEPSKKKKKESNLPDAPFKPSESSDSKASPTGSSPFGKTPDSTPELIKKEESERLSPTKHSTKQELREKAISDSPDMSEQSKEKNKLKLAVAPISPSKPGTRISLTAISFRRPTHPTRLKPINSLELIETIRRIPGYSSRLAYVKDHVLPKNPSISKEELSILLAITVGEAAVLLSDARKKS